MLPVYSKHLQFQQLQMHYCRPETRRMRPQGAAHGRERNMEFGYFTLSDNHYENNKRDANTFVTDITNEALYADQIGMHSAWIGEHHFNSLGVLSCPDLVLSYIAARTKHIRLAPAVPVTQIGRA